MTRPGLHVTATAAAATAVVAATAATAAVAAVAAALAAGKRELLEAESRERAKGEVSFCGGHRDEGT